MNLYVALVVLMIVFYVFEVRRWNAVVKMYLDMQRDQYKEMYDSQREQHRVTQEVLKEISDTLNYHSLQLNDLKLRKTIDALLEDARSL